MMDLSKKWLEHRHFKYGWLPILYDIVKDFKPKKIIEVGTGVGETTITMALALKENGIGKIHSYDIWSDWNDGNTLFEECLESFKEWEVDDLIELKNFDFYEWIKLPVSERKFDIFYFDLNNNGDKLLDLYRSVKEDINDGSIVLFEGGSVERDNHGLSRHGCKKMNDVKDEIGYQVLTDNIKYSFSIIYNKNMYELNYDV